MTWVAAAVTVGTAAYGAYSSNKAKQDAKGDAAERLRRLNIPFYAGKGEKTGKKFIDYMANVYGGGDPINNVKSVEALKATPAGDALGGVGAPMASTAYGAPATRISETGHDTSAKAFGDYLGQKYGDIASTAKLKEMAGKIDFQGWQGGAMLETLAKLQERIDAANAAKTQSIMAGVNAIGSGVAGGVKNVQGGKGFWSGK